MNSKSGLVCFMVIILYTASCQFGDSNQFTGNYTLQYDTLHIELDVESPQTFSEFSHRLNTKGEIEMVAYNASAHALEWYNIDEGKMIKRLYLELEGPDGVNPVSMTSGGLYFHNPDSVFYYTSDIIAFYTINMNDGQITKLDFAASFLNESQVRPHIDQSARLYYSKASDKIPFINMYMGNSDNGIDMCVFDMKLKKFSLITIPHTESNKNAMEFGFLNMINISRPVGKKFFINFLYSGKTYMLLADENKLSQIIEYPDTDHSLYHPDNDDGNIHALKSVWYHSIEKLNEDFFIRIVWEGAEHNPMIRYPMLEKRHALQVFNPEFKLLATLPLESGFISPWMWFVENGAIYFHCAHPSYKQKNENTMEIIRVQVISE